MKNYIRKGQALINHNLLHLKQVSVESLCFYKDLDVNCFGFPRTREKVTSGRRSFLAIMLHFCLVMFPLVFFQFFSQRLANCRSGCCSASCLQFCSGLSFKGEKYQRKFFRPITKKNQLHPPTIFILEYFFRVFHLSRVSKKT